MSYKMHFLIIGLLDWVQKRMRNLKLILCWNLSYKLWHFIQSELTYPMFPLNKEQFITKLMINIFFNEPQFRIVTMWFSWLNSDWFYKFLSDIFSCSSNVSIWSSITENINNFTKTEKKLLELCAILKMKVIH